MTTTREVGLIFLAACVIFGLTAMVANNRFSERLATAVSVLTGLYGFFFVIFGG